MDLLYRGREWVASLPSFLLVLALMLLSAQTLTPRKKDAPLYSPVQISLVAPPEPAPQAQAPEQKVVEPKPEPVKPAPPQPVAKAVTAPAPVSAPPAPEGETASVPAPSAPPAPAQKTAQAAPEAPPAPPPPRISQNTENSFIARVRAYLESVKRYPTGREASSMRPRGKTRVWFVLTRGGEATESGIEDSSGALLLDNAALATVRRGRFPAFPDDAWPGKPSYRFTAELDFVPAE